MAKFASFSGLVAPLDRDDVDTDAIIPKQFMKSIFRTGFGDNLFDAWRYLDEGEPGADNSKRPLNPEFVLNQPRYRAAAILLARKNFGCGSSREHAPWALLQYGFKVVLATSFAEIFMGNCYKNGLLTVALEEAQIEDIFRRMRDLPAYVLTVSLENQTVSDGYGNSYGFAISAYVKEALMTGSDEISLSLAHQEETRAFEEQRFQRYPWLQHPVRI